MQALKQFAYGTVFGAGFLALILFSTGLATFTSTAREHGTEMYKRAVADNLTPICVAQFKESPEATAKFAALKELGSDEHAGFVMENGWATMPGRDRPDDRIARDCAQQILRLDL